MQEVLGIKLPIIGNFVEVNKSGGTPFDPMPKKDVGSCRKEKNSVEGFWENCQFPLAFVLYDYILRLCAEKVRGNAPSNFFLLCKIVRFFAKPFGKRLVIRLDCGFSLGTVSCLLRKIYIEFF